MTEIIKTANSNMSFQSEIVQAAQQHVLQIFNDNVSDVKRIVIQ